MRNRPQPTLLCIDDEPLDLELQKSALESFGMSVFTALDWATAGPIFRNNKVDLVLLDYRLRRSSAIDVAVEIRKLSPRMPIVLLSGYLHDVPEYFRRAVDGSLSKHELPEAWVAELLRHFEPGLPATAI